MGQAKCRGTYVERREQAIIKNEKRKKERDKKLAEFRAEQLRVKEELESTLSVEEKEERKKKQEKILEEYYCIRSLAKGFL